MLGVIGIWLFRSGRLAGRRVALAWAVFALLPLFGAGAYQFFFVFSSDTHDTLRHVVPAEES
ncbi:hypothetical protein [Stakelama saccharophila]|uniref:Cardiolipin synthase N-terminal domain-containing protein n=1 Tax=Stakelama saccharophila TaxID=3075605 RepID=A0ABZ0B961_9SPHN|nr:hypothetical protein [Stakelama sp. W311]WNO52854.1 hypothetical protein RPR59_10335 [Stakelama sp. W311]